MSFASPTNLARAQAPVELLALPQHTVVVAASPALATVAIAGNDRQDGKPVDLAERMTDEVGSEN